LRTKILLFVRRTIIILTWKYFVVKKKRSHTIRKQYPSLLPPRVHISYYCIYCLPIYIIIMQTRHNIISKNNNVLHNLLFYYVGIIRDKLINKQMQLILHCYIFIIIINVRALYAIVVRPRYGAFICCLYYYYYYIGQVIILRSSILFTRRIPLNTRWHFYFFSLFYAYHYYLRFTFKIRFLCYYNKRGGGNNHLFGLERGHERARDRDRSTAAAARRYTYMRPRPRLANDGICYLYYSRLGFTLARRRGHRSRSPPRSSHGQEVVRRHYSNNNNNNYYYYYYYYAGIQIHRSWCI